MNDSADYLIQIQGQIDEHDLNAMSPLEIKIVCADDSATSFEVCTDQSGLVGLLRHLHTRNFTFLSITIQLANHEGGKRDYF